MNRKAPEDVMMNIRDAQEWCRLPSLGSPSDRAAFVSWVCESPANLAAYLMNTMLDVELRSLDSERQFDLDALIASAARETQAPVDDSNHQSVRVADEV
jgi:hypothetical protein